MKTIIELDNLTIRAHDKTLLHGITLHVNEGEHLLIGGDSGSGKSTLLNMLMGGHIPAGGTYRYDSITVDHHTINTVRTRMAFIGQEPVLGAATVREALLVPFSFKANSHINPTEEQITAALGNVRLNTDILNQRIDTVSGGEKQRLVIARALLMDKKVFLVDEATSALDPESKQAVLDVFTGTGATIISVSHDPAWQTLATRTVILDKGRVIG